MDIEDFFTLDKENEGSKFYLYDPQDKQTKEWILVYGAHSDEFRKAEYEYQKATLGLTESTTLNEEDRRVAIENEHTKMISSLIKGWSFDVECTTQSKFKLLKNAPRTAERINIFAKKGSLFFRSEEKT